MNRSKLFSASLLAACLATSASASLFDTMESVETLQTIAARNQKTDRMPAGTESKPVAEETTSGKNDGSASEEAKQSN